MIWTDYNGNEHKTNDLFMLKDQLPDCKYILPCGLCSLYPELKTCVLMKYEVKDNDQ